MTSSDDEFAARYVAWFNDAVASGDFSSFLARFDDEAVMRFENVPGAGTLEFAGRTAYTAAYAQQPPDDQISITGPVGDDAGALVIPFVWARDGQPGVMRLALDAGRISRLTVTFG